MKFDNKEFRGYTQVHTHGVHMLVGDGPLDGMIFKIVYLNMVTNICVYNVITPPLIKVYNYNKDIDINWDDACYLCEGFDGINIDIYWCGFWRVRNGRRFDVDHDVWYNFKPEILNFIDKYCRDKHLCYRVKICSNKLNQLVYYKSDFLILVAVTNISTNTSSIPDDKYLPSLLNARHSTYFDRGVVNEIFYSSANKRFHHEYDSGKNIIDLYYNDFLIPSIVKIGADGKIYEYQSKKFDMTYKVFNNISCNTGLNNIFNKAILNEDDKNIVTSYYDKINELYGQIMLKSINLYFRYYEDKISPFENMIITRLLRKEHLTINSIYYYYTK